MRYDECREWLENRRLNLGSVPGLEAVRELLSYAGNPDKDMTFIHIAGTNGKGSIGCLLEATLAESKIKCGRFYSPSVTDERDIISINNKLLPKTKWEKHLSYLIELIENNNLKATAFEIEFVLALLMFKEANCEIVILECGMGGLLDATNVIERSLVDIISSISIDHCNFLGDTLKEISLHKFGIIKDTSSNVILAPQKEEIYEYFSEYVDKNLKTRIRKITNFKKVKNTKTDKNSNTFNVIKSDSKLAKHDSYVRDDNVFLRLSYKDYKDLDLLLSGTYQINNAITVLDAIDVLKAEGYQIKDNAVRKAFANTKWPARFEIIKKDKLYILDGAHNIDAVDRLFESIKLYFTKRKLVYIMGMYKDKAYEEVVKKYAPSAKAIVTITPKDSKRALDAFELGKIVKDYNPNVTGADSYREAIEIAELLSDKKDIIVVFGSLSFMGEIRDILLNKKSDNLFN
ncbi:MAG: hypothetical protein J6Z07_08635 [Lachnospiraceae bacterium]|nr:hypothetical protein [Lachnospiraceae bacterium]